MILILAKNAIKYWHRLINLQDNSLVKLSYRLSINPENNPDEGTWSYCIKNVLEKFDYGHFWTYQNPYSDIHSDLSYRFEKYYETEWLQRLNMPGSMNNTNSGNKLRTYCTFKTSFILENYIAQNPLLQRRNLTKLRISNHHLAIETGRYTNPPTPVHTCCCQILQHKRNRRRIPLLNKMHIIQPRQAKTSGKT